MKFKINQKIKEFKPVKIELELESIDEAMSLHAYLGGTTEEEDFSDHWNDNIHTKEDFYFVWEKLDDIITNHFEAK
jgi:hypothetical protein